MLICNQILFLESGLFCASHWSLPLFTLPGKQNIPLLIRGLGNNQRITPFVTTIASIAQDTSLMVMPTVLQQAGWLAVSVHHF